MKNTAFLNRVTALVAMAAGLVLLGTGGARAQTQAAVSTLSAGGAQELTAPTSKAELTRADDAESRDKTPMAWAGLGVKLGLAGMGAGALTVYGQEGRTDPRMGLQVSMPIHLGGDGFGWIFEPFLARSSIGHDVKDVSGRVVGSETVDLNAYGMYLGPQINIQVARPVYVGFGLGVKGAYLVNDGFDYALDLYGRVPLNATYYVSDQFALVAEVGFGYGVSVFVDEPRIAIDPVTRAVRNVKDDPLFGTAFAWDASIGIRLP